MVVLGQFNKLGAKLSRAEQSRLLHAGESASSDVLLPGYKSQKMVQQNPDGFANFCTTFQKFGVSNVLDFGLTRMQVSQQKACQSEIIPVSQYNKGKLR